MLAHLKMTGVTPEVRSDKSLTFVTFDILHSTNRPMDQWTNGPVDQWSSGPMDQWTNVDSIVVPLFSNPIHKSKLHWDEQACLDQWTDGSLDQWTNRPMDQWTNWPLDQWTNEAMEQLTNGPVDQWTNGPINQWTNGPVDQWKGVHAQNLKKWPPA